MNTKSLLVLIAVIVIGIFAVIIIEASQNPSDKSFVSGIGKVTEDIGNEINNQTNSG